MTYSVHLPDGAETLIDELRSARLPEPGERRRTRIAAGASLQDVAAALGVTPMTVQRWETGHAPRRAHATAYRALLEALGEVAS